MNTLHTLPRRLGRAFALFLVTALVVLPITASAAPAVSTEDAVTQLGNGNNGNGGGSENANGGSNANESAPGQNKDDSGSNANESAPGQNKDDSGSNANESAPGQNKDDSGSNANESAPGQNRLPGDPPPGQAGTAPGQANPTPGQAVPNGVAAGFGGGPPSLVPSGVTPTEGGLGALDLEVLPEHLGAAVMLFDQEDVTPAPVEAPVDTGFATSVADSLDLALPPALTDVVTSPLVIFEALVEAMVASGQALLIPLAAGALAFLMPGLRRRDVMDAALQGDDVSR